MKVATLASAIDSGQCPVEKGVAGHSGGRVNFDKSTGCKACLGHFERKGERALTFIASREEHGLPLDAKGYEVAAAKDKAEKAAARAAAKKTARKSTGRKTSGTRKSTTKVANVQSDLHARIKELDDQLAAAREELREANAKEVESA